jgi:hypothetical protein
MIRLAADGFMESDETAVKEIVERALCADVKDFILSVSGGSRSNHAVIARLLHWCGERVRQNSGQLFFFEKNTGGECVFGSLCDALRIPMYRTGKRPLNPGTRPAASDPLAA